MTQGSTEFTEVLERLQMTFLGRESRYKMLSVQRDDYSLYYMML